MRVMCLLLALLCGHNVVHAACEIEPGHYGPKLSETAMKARNDFYEIECIRAGGSLIDSTDPTLKGRLDRPSGVQAPSSEPYHQYGVKLGVKKSPELVFILDAEGVVQDIAVIESSGNNNYDAAIVELVKRMKWKQPARLDGKPIPVLSYMRYDLHPRR